MNVEEERQKKEKNPPRLEILAGFLMAIASPIFVLDAVRGKKRKRREEGELTPEELRKLRDLEGVGSGHRRPDGLRNLVEVEDDD